MIPRENGNAKLNSRKLLHNGAEKLFQYLGHDRFMEMRSAN
jgi:hypothetical protein